MRILIAAVAIAFMTVAANAQTAQSAQTPQSGQAIKGKHAMDEPKVEDPATAKANEQAYQAALKRIPNANDKPDPWKGMR
jgi:hypothetical protein